MKEIKSEITFNPGNMWKRRGVTRQAYNKENFEKLRMETKNDPIAITEFALHNQITEAIEGASPFLAFACTALALYSCKRLVRYKLLSPAGKWTAGLGVGFGTLFAIGFKSTWDEGRRRKRIDRIEAIGDLYTKVNLTDNNAKSII